MKPGDVLIAEKHPQLINQESLGCAEFHSED